MNSMTDDQLGMAANLGVELFPNEQNYGRTTPFKGQYVCASLASLHLTLR